MTRRGPTNPLGPQSAPMAAAPVVVELPRPLPIALLTAQFQAEPFRPFRLVLDDGSDVLIDNPRRCRWDGRRQALLLRRPGEAGVSVVAWPAVRRIEVRDADATR